MHEVMTAAGADSLAAEGTTAHALARVHAAMVDLVVAAQRVSIAHQPGIRQINEKDIGALRDALRPFDSACSVLSKGAAGDGLAEPDGLAFHRGRAELMIEATDGKRIAVSMCQRGISPAPWVIADADVANTWINLEQHSLWIDKTGFGLRPTEIARVQALLARVAKGDA